MPSRHRRTLGAQLAIAAVCCATLGVLWWWDSLVVTSRAPSDTVPIAHEEAEPRPQPFVSLPELLPVPFAAASTVPEAGHRRVRIVDGNRAPVAGAMVAFDLARNVVLADAVTPFGSVLIDRPLAIDREAALAGAPHFASASDGTVELPTVDTSLFVVARADDSYGQGVVLFDGLLLDIPEIVIAPDRNLHLRVVDPTGKPRANVPVRVAFQLGENSNGPVPASIDLEPSDEDGRVTLWHAQSLPFWDRSQAAVTVRAMVLGASTTSVHVPLAMPLPGALVVPCPPHWSLRVRTWLAKDIPTTGGERPALAMVDEASKFVWLERDLLSWERVHEGPELRVPSGGCPQVVALGKAVAVAWQMAADRVAGPASDGEQVTLDLFPLHRVVALRLLLPDGKPCAETRVSLVEDGDHQFATTDTAGRLQFAIGSRACHVLVDCQTRHCRQWVCVPATDAAPGPLELGDLQLAAQQRVASGRVVDATTGAALPAIVELGESGLQLTEGDGTFELWSSSSYTAPCEVELVATSQGYHEQRLGVPVGGTGVVVALMPRRRQVNTLLADPDIVIAAMDEMEHRWSGDPLRQSVFRGRAVTLFRPAGESDEPKVDDQRGKLANIAVTVEQPGADVPWGAIYTRAKGRPDTGSGWRLTHTTDPRTAPRDGIGNRCTLVVEKGTVLEAVVRVRNGPCVACDLHAGENVVPLPTWPRAVLTIEGATAEVPQDCVCIGAFMLEQREPLLDLVGEAAPVRSWSDFSALPLFVEGFFHGHVWWPDNLCQVPERGPATLRLGPRGRYMVVPFVYAQNRGEWYPDAAIPVDLGEPDQIVHATIRIDAAKVRAGR